MRPYRILACFAALTLVEAACAPSEQVPSTPSVGNVEKLASQVFGVESDEIEERGEERNLVGVRSRFVVVSQRTDSRTYFVRDMRYQGSNELGVFEGSDEELIEISRKFMDELEVPPEEIAQASVLTERLQTAQFDPGTRQYRPGPITTGKRFVEMTRVVEGVPVFSSRALVGIAQDERVGSLEAHWPEIPEDVIAQAQELQELVRAGWEPPAQEGATVESVEAGVIHSPAIGFAMDIYPVIRVIVASEEPEVGKKGVLYLDRDGRPVPVPRTFLESDEPPPGERRSKSQ